MALIDKYSEKELRNIVKNCHSLKEVLSTIGYSTVSGNNSLTIKKRLNFYKIDTSHFSYTTKTERRDDNVFISDSTATQAVLRRHYKAIQGIQYRCTICGQIPV